MTDHLASRLPATTATGRCARMRTPWRTAAPLLAIAVTVVVGGCMNPPARTDSQPSSSTPAEQTTAPTTPAEPSCPPSGLFVSTGPVDGAAGLRAVTLTAFNCATSTVPVEGYPQLQLLDEAQAVIDVTVVQELDPVGGLTDVAVTPLTLLPGQTAQAVLLWRNTVELGGDNTPGSYLGVTVTPGGTEQVLELDVDLGTTGELTVGPWRTPA